MRVSLLACFAALAALPPPPAGAVLIRADRDDEEYRELATRYPSALALATGGGVLITPRWVLTAAPPAVALRDRKAPLRIAGRVHAIQEVFVHPDWTAAGEADVALILLREPVEAVEPTAIHRAGDEAGRAVRLVGFGETGRIGEKAGPAADRTARASINTVDRVDARTLGLRIKPADEASDLQGAAAPGDRGAPAFFEIGGQILVGGLYSMTEDTNGDGIRGNVGDWERLTRVSAFAAWIDGVIANVAANESAAAVGDTERR
jgi:hypothetical protein